MFIEPGIISRRVAGYVLASVRSLLCLRVRARETSDHRTPDPEHAGRRVDEVVVRGAASGEEVVL